MKTVKRSGPGELDGEHLDAGHAALHPRRNLAVQGLFLVIKRCHLKKKGRGAPISILLKCGGTRIATERLPGTTAAVDNASMARPDLAVQLAESRYDAPGFAATYDRYRPRPPEVLLDMLPRLAGAARPRLVVDLGSGTGLSTRVWAERAEEAVGIEPNDAMRVEAESATQAANVRYLGGSSYETGLPDMCADVVTCSQSLQWMEPEPTFTEIARLLRPGGVFCAYEYRGLTTGSWAPEEALEATMAAATRIGGVRGLAKHSRRFPPSAERLESSGVFRSVRELSLHSVEQGDGERLVGLTLALGTVRRTLDDGATEEELGLDRLRQIASKLPEGPWVWEYRAWLGLR